MPLRGKRGGHSRGFIRSLHVTVAGRGWAVLAAASAPAAPLVAAPGPLRIMTLQAAAAALLAAVSAWVAVPVLLDDEEPLQAELLLGIRAALQGLAREVATGTAKGFQDTMDITIPR